MKQQGTEIPRPPATCGASADHGELVSSKRRTGRAPVSVDENRIAIV